jgi:PAS domain S-box-containing protein
LVGAAGLEPATVGLENRRAYSFSPYPSVFSASSFFPVVHSVTFGDDLLQPNGHDFGQHFRDLSRCTMWAWETINPQRNRNLGGAACERVPSWRSSTASAVSIIPTSLRKPQGLLPCALTSEISNRFDFDHSATPMRVFDLSTLAFSAVNDAAVSHYGYSRKEFLSMTILDIRPSEDIVPLLREIMLEGIHNSEKELRKHKKKDGTLIDVEVTRCETMFNGCLADIVSAVDVTRHPGRVSDCQ